MLRYYGVDVLDVHRGRMTLRRLKVLIAGLPPESATRYAMTHPSDVADLRWRDAEFLLAHQANMMHAQFRLSWSAATHGKSKPPHLDPILSPDDQANERAKEAERKVRTAIKLSEIRKLGAGTREFKPLPEHLERLARERRPAPKARPQDGMTDRMRQIRKLGEGTRKCTPAPQTEKLRR